ncbi:MAG: spermidine synthase [Planctomycetota bacterium]
MRHSVFGVRAAGWALWILSLLTIFQGCTEPEKTDGGGKKDASLIYETRSDYSHIRVRDRGSVRGLFFVRDTGQEVTETAIDLDAPHRLQIPYTRYMFLSYLFRTEHEKCLIVGLGGGAMIRFLNHHFPELNVDAVEIDPAVVKVASEYFGTKPGPKTRIFTEDAFKFLGRKDDKYDVIYMDAFLKPSADTDRTGVPLHLKTIEFFKSLHGNLKEKGLVIFNINLHPGLSKDIDAIKKAYPRVYTFTVPGRRNRIVVASLDTKRVLPPDLEERARKLDKEKDWGFYFSTMARKLQ